MLLLEIMLQFYALILRLCVHMCEILVETEDLEINLPGKCVLLSSLIQNHHDIPQSENGRYKQNHSRIVA